VGYPKGLHEKEGDPFPWVLQDKEESELVDWNYCERVYKM
jgi:hypothetical protein